MAYDPSVLFCRFHNELEDVRFSRSVGCFVGQQMYGSRIETYAVLHGPLQPNDQDLRLAAYMAEDECPF